MIRIFRCTCLRLWHSRTVEVHNASHSWNIVAFLNASVDVPICLAVQRCSLPFQWRLYFCLELCVIMCYKNGKVLIQIIFYFKHICLCLLMCETQDVPKRCIYTRLIFRIIMCIHIFGTPVYLRNSLMRFHLPPVVHVDPPLVQYRWIEQIKSI
jgi:hypothetical protein